MKGTGNANALTGTGLFVKCLSRPTKNTVGSKFLGWCKVDGNSTNANKMKSENKNSNVIFNKKTVTSILPRKKM